MTPIPYIPLYAQAIDGRFLIRLKQRTEDLVRVLLLLARLYYVVRVLSVHTGAPRHCQRR